MPPWAATSGGSNRQRLWFFSYLDCLSEKETLRTGEIIGQNTADPKPDYKPLSQEKHGNLDNPGTELGSRPDIYAILDRVAVSHRSRRTSDRSLMGAWCLEELRGERKSSPVPRTSCAPPPPPGYARVGRSNILVVTKSPLLRSLCYRIPALVLRVPSPNERPRIVNISAHVPDTHTVLLPGPRNPPTRSLATDPISGSRPALTKWNRTSSLPGPGGGQETRQGGLGKARLLTKQLGSPGESINRGVLFYFYFYFF